MGLSFLFLQRDPVPNLATMCLAAVLKPLGHTVEVLIAPAEPDVLRSARRVDPDVICFSATTGEHRWQLDLARRIKERWAPLIVMGGAHPTFHPQVLADSPQLDYIVRGEGEHAIVDLAAVVEGRADPSTVGNLGWRDAAGEVHLNEVRPLEQDLDRFPFPDRSVYERYDFVRDRRTVSVISSRGCPYRCSFCFNVALQDIYRGKGRYVRTKSPRRMIDELRDLLTRYPHVRRVGFTDDIFVLDYRGWGREFLDLYAAEIGLPFSCLLRPDGVTKQMARSLGRAGCRLAKIGLETGDEDLRRGVLAKGKLDNEGMVRAARLLKAEGVQVLTFNIVGSPGETLDGALSTVDLNVRMGTDHAWASLCQPYPGTKLEQFSVDEGFLDRVTGGDDFGHSYFVDTPLRSEQKRELVNLHKLLPLLVMAPRLRPLARAVVKLPHNPLFGAVFHATYAWGLVRTGQLDAVDVVRLAPLALRNRWG